MIIHQFGVDNVGQSHGMAVLVHLVRTHIYMCFLIWFVACLYDTSSGSSEDARAYAHLIQSVCVCVCIY